MKSGTKIHAPPFFKCCKSSLKYKRYFHFLSYSRYQLKKANIRMSDLQHIKQQTKSGSISVSGQLLTYPSPNPTLTLTCHQLTIVGLGEG